MNPEPAAEAVEAVSTLKSLGKKALDKLTSHLTPQESFGHFNPTENFAESAMQASRQPVTVVSQKLDGTLGSSGFTHSQVGMGMVAPARPVALQRMDAFKKLPDEKMSTSGKQFLLTKLERPAFLPESSVSVDIPPKFIPRPAPLERSTGLSIRPEDYPITKNGLNIVQIQDLQKQGYSFREIDEMLPERYFELMKKKMAAVGEPKIPLETERLTKSDIPVLKDVVPDSSLPPATKAKSKIASSVRFNDKKAVRTFRRGADDEVVLLGDTIDETFGPGAKS